MLVLACAPLAACSHAPARLSDTWAVTAGPSGAAFVDRAYPTEGKPLLETAQTRRECLTDADLLAVLGAPCDHETENPHPRPPAGDLTPGIPELTPEVRWYCGGSVVVRVVLERCDATGAGDFDGVRPIELAVATRSSGS